MRNWMLKGALLLTAALLVPPARAGKLEFRSTEAAGGSGARQLAGMLSPGRATPPSGWARDGARASLLAQRDVGSGDGIGRNRHLSTIGLSLLLPGTAQLRAGDTGRGLLFLGAEGAIWTAFATYRVRGGLRRDSYLEMARLFAGVEHPDGRDDDYYRLLGLINSSDVYDIVVRADARRLYGDDLEAREAYLAEHRIQGDRAWHWESDAARVRYREKRNDSQRTFRASRNMIGLAVVNRFAAMFDAVLSHRGEGSTHIRISPDPDLGIARLALTRELP